MDRPTPEQLDVEGLRSLIHGEVLTGADPGYDAARAVWNAMIDARPAVIVRCRGVADVIDAVGFARGHGLPVSIRGGGHNVTGHAVGSGGVMIDLSAMRAIRVDPVGRAAWIEGGATWRDVDRNTQAFGLATPGGLISDTGVAGLTLSGGIGWLRARHGLCIDNLLSADTVTADGRLLHASAAENADLLWALRGGGGNFGVVTGFELALHPVGPEVMFCAPLYPIEAGPEPIRFWRDFLANKNDRVGSLVEFSTVPNDPAYPEIAGPAGLHRGRGLERRGRRGRDCPSAIARAGRVGRRLSGRLRYCDVQRLFDAVIPFGRHRCYWKCHYLASLDDGLIDRILEANAEPPSPSTLSSIWNFGGAVAAVPVPADGSAFGDRSMPWMFSIDAIWSAPADDEANIAWARKLWDELRPHSHLGRMYLNFPGHGEDGEALVRSTFGANYGRLRAIKKKYDPANMFRFNQNIPPEATG